MNFGNWNVNENGISWAGSELQRFVIPVDELNKVRQSKDKAPMYEWILLATEEDWLSGDDLYDLNYAFVFAIAKYGSNFNYEILDDTLEEQFDQFEAEDIDDVDSSAIS